MQKVALVVLNYKSYELTSRLIDSLVEYCRDEFTPTVIIVDNGGEFSDFELFKKQICRHETVDFEFVHSPENLGFANGMNLGIAKAKEVGCLNIVCSNSDIVFSEGFKFSELLSLASNNPSIGAIGIRITGEDGSPQNPMYGLETPVKFSKQKYIIKKVIFGSLIGRYAYYLRGVWVRYIQSNRTVNTLQSQVVCDKSRRVYCLHGAFFMLTESYFNYYEGLDKNTFLYTEELILAERMRIKKLEPYYYCGLNVVHSSGASTKIENSGSRLASAWFVTKHKYNSMSYFIKEYGKRMIA